MEKKIAYKFNDHLSLQIKNCEHVKERTENRNETFTNKGEKTAHTFLNFSHIS